MEQPVEQQQEEEQQQEQPETVENHEETAVNEQKPVEKTPKLTAKELLAQAKQRAIDNFEKGIEDLEFKVVKCKNGKYRCTKRKEPLPPTPINVNQIEPNVGSSGSIRSEPEKPKKKKEIDPALKDIVYFNLNSQVNEQLNKRLDLLNAQIERLNGKNAKLKGKYKQLKQAIFITDDEDENEPVEQEQLQAEPFHESQPLEKPIPRTMPRTRVIDYNRFFR